MGVVGGSLAGKGGGGGGWRGGGSCLQCNHQSIKRLM